MTKFNICIVQPEGYVHSHAFMELAELLYFSLHDLNHVADLNFNMVMPNEKNIIIGVHLLTEQAIALLPASTIILNTEQIAVDEMLWNSTIYSYAQKFEVWDYSPKNIEKFKSLGYNNVKLLKIGFQPQLARIKQSTEQDIDVLFYGATNERREFILKALIDSGLKVKFLFGVYGRERDHWIARSKTVLNMHLFQSKIFEVVRVFYLFTNSIPVIGEVDPETAIEERYKEGIFPAAYDEIVEKTIELVRNDHLRKLIAKAGYEAISRYPQKHFTQAVL